MLSVVFFTSLAICILVSLAIATAAAGALLVTDPEQSSTPIDTDRLTLVIVTIASDNVWETLRETINHTTDQFDQYDVHVLTDEGADREADLQSISTITLHTVPDTFTPANATGKGRAIEWFTRTHADDNHWYAFIDDDNRILDDAFLYEIPAQEARGRRAMNPVLIPRRGQSVLAFVLDHVRTLFDLTVYRVATGTGYPVFGLHGELLTVRGDVLKEVGFDRDTVAEDFAFADALYERGIRTWQSATRVSILSPHSLVAFVQQRRRWTVGQLQTLRNATWSVRVATVGMHGTWTLGVLTNWILGGIYFVVQPVFLPLHFWLLGVFGATAYTLTYASGLYRTGRRWLILTPVIPVIATIEHIVPWAVAVLELRNRTDDFTVIDK